jgi:hypothetical protein
MRSGFFVPAGWVFTSATKVCAELQNSFVTKIIMKEPRFKADELWETIRSIYTTGTPFYSLIQRKEYHLVAIDESEKNYTVRYESGNMISVPLKDLYAIYRELYRVGDFSRKYLRQPESGRRIVGHTHYCGSPGATIYGILPALDGQIAVKGRGCLTIPAQ